MALRTLLNARRGYHIGLLHSSEKTAKRLASKLETAQKNIKHEHSEVHRYDVALATKDPAKPFTMYDSVTVSEIPKDAKAVAGYVGGRWPTFFQLQRQFPKAKRLSIAVNAGEDARCLDVEAGDATPLEAPAWVRRQHARGIRRPVVYCSLSVLPQVLAALTNAGIQRAQYLVWVAHYTGIPHIEPGADACQYTNQALGRNLDASLCQPWFLP